MSPETDDESKKIYEKPEVFHQACHGGGGSTSG